MTASAARRQSYWQALCILQAVRILKVCARAGDGSTRAWLSPQIGLRRNGRGGATHSAFAMTYSAFAISHSLNFCTLPVEVFGSSVKTMWRGIL